jgi:hypothetical protein
LVVVPCFIGLWFLHHGFSSTIDHLSTGSFDFCFNSGVMCPKLIHVIKLLSFAFTFKWWLDLVWYLWITFFLKLLSALGQYLFVVDTMENSGSRFFHLSGDCFILLNCKTNFLCPLN